jgi:hypothetical protein
MARLGNYSYLVMNNESSMVEVKIFTPWHELNEIIKQCFIRFKCTDLTDTCMRAFATTSLGILLCGSTTPNDTFSALITRCNVFLKFKGDHSHFITATTIHEKIKKAITSVPSIKADMLTYEQLIASGSMNTSAMVKKADVLVPMHSNRMHIADSASQTFTTMMQPQEITAAIQRTGTSKYFT